MHISIPPATVGVQAVQNREGDYPAEGMHVRVPYPHP